MSNSRKKTNLRNLFQEYAKLGDEKSSANNISYKQAETWLKQANIMQQILDGEKVAQLFNQYSQNNLGYYEFLNFVTEVAKEAKISPTEATRRLLGAPVPQEAVRRSSRIFRRSFQPPSKTILGNVTYPGTSKPDENK